MIFRRQWPKATGPCETSPLASGPRGLSTPIIARIAAGSAAPPKLISPQIPHMAAERLSLGTPRRHNRAAPEPFQLRAVGGAPARGPDLSNP
ncbi:hypothetical protein GCM10007886_34990 [Methylobacterium gregans]|nr:hypothetical protein GCM10007886_34990 [Methylobacterium gregans]